MTKTKIFCRDGLLFTSIEVMYAGRHRTIDNVAIDFGMTRTVISADCAEGVGIRYECGDGVTCGEAGGLYVFEKRLDGIQFGPFCVDPCNVDFGDIDPKGNINGLLGLDLLLKVGAVIDLKNLLLYEGT